MEFSFRSVEDKKERIGLVDFMHRQSLSYPRYHEWVQKAEFELERGYKKAISAYSGKIMVADIVWQPHKEIKGFLEIKNLRVSPELRFRGFARFMLRQLEVDSNNKYSAFICDAPSEEDEIISSMVQCGYVPIKQIQIYDDSLETVMVKFLTN